ncbi:Porin [Roseobacter fucihabitans]|uniref:Porin n=1 Tax=Roseobacter fucihabitans TaxID=1537242 RepID=A0ABZ2BX47_9RHOB|nr:porin [Roseobacter litoralis]MBC6967647.1 Porin [Roseobacter litoralis]
MKKLLIATTALVGTASVAGADIANFNFSGYGRFGILYEEDRASDGVMQEETRLESRYRLNIDSSTTTDGGIRFAARIRVEANENADNSANQGVFSGARFQASSGGLRVRVGNISGVTDSAEVVNYFGFEPGLVGQTGQYANSGVSLPAFASTGAGNNGINVKYEIGDFAVMGSWTDDHDTNDGSTAAGGDFSDSYEIGASYTFSGWTVGAAYGKFEQTARAAVAADATTFTAAIPAVAASDNDFWVITANGSLGVADVSFLVSDFEADADTVFGASASIPVGAATNVVASVSDGGAATNDTSFGLGFTHSLGGGVSLSGMAGQNASGNTIADLGVRFDF